MKTESPSASSGASALLGATATLAGGRNAGTDSTEFRLDLDVDISSHVVQTSARSDARSSAAVSNADRTVERTAAQLREWHRDQPTSRAVSATNVRTGSARTDTAVKAAADRTADRKPEPAEQTRTRDAGRSATVHSKLAHHRTEAQQQTDAGDDESDAVVDETAPVTTSTTTSTTTGETATASAAEADAGAAASASGADSTVPTRPVAAATTTDDAADAAGASVLRLESRGDAAQQAVWQRLQSLLGADVQRAVSAALDDGSLRMEFTMALAQSEVPAEVLADVPVAATQGLKGAAATTLPVAQTLPALAANSPTPENGALAATATPAAAQAATAQQVLASLAALLAKQESAATPGSSETGESLALATLGSSAASEVARQMAVGSMAASTPPAATTADPAGRLMLMQDNWATDLVDRVQVQAREMRQEARIELHPQEMGAMMIRIHFSDGVPQVQFAADSAQARAALQAALPQLQQMFASAGLAAPQVQVGERLGARSGRVTADPVTASESATDAPRRKPRGRDARALDRYA